MATPQSTATPIAKVEPTECKELSIIDLAFLTQSLRHKKQKTQRSQNSTAWWKVNKIMVYTLSLNRFTPIQT